jgi:hypothetical protein
MPLSLRQSFGRQHDAAPFAQSLMDYSERHLAQASRFGSPREVELATRLLQDVSLFSRWEQSHSRMMHSVAAAPRATQRVQLRKVAFATLHRKAPFEYLRDRRITGQARRRWVAALFGSQEYSKFLVREHAAFVSAACSYFCVDSLCDMVLHDTAFCRALEQYETAYTEYYRAYCDIHLEEVEEEAEALKALLPYLREKLKMTREYLLAGAPQHGAYMDMQALYAASGDTVQLPVLRQAASQA